MKVLIYLIYFIKNLYFEKSKYKFYSELSNNIQFEYSVVPPLLTLSKKDALLLNIEPKIIDPLSNEKVTKLFIIMILMYSYNKLLI